jgi:hypothetical protein
VIFDRVAIGAGALALAALVGLLAWRIVALRARPGPPPVPLDAVALASLAQADRALRRGFFAVSGLVAVLVAVLAIDRSARSA